MLGRKKFTHKPCLGMLEVSKGHDLETLTTGEAAHVLDCSKSQVRYLRDIGLLDAYQDKGAGTWSRITVQSLEDLMWAKYKKDFNSSIKRV